MHALSLHSTMIFLERHIPLFANFFQNFFPKFVSHLVVTNMTVGNVPRHKFAFSYTFHLLFGAYYIRVHFCYRDGGIFISEMKYYNIVLFMLFAFCFSCCSFFTLCFSRLLIRYSYLAFALLSYVSRTIICGRYTPMVTHTQHRPRHIRLQFDIYHGCIWSVTAYTGTSPPRLHALLTGT